MANAQRNRSRRNDARSRGPRYIAPVLDPTWENPYAPSRAERDGHLNAVIAFTRRKRLPFLIVESAVAVLAAIAAVMITPFVWIVAVAAIAVGVWDFQRASKAPAAVASLGSRMLAAFEPGGSPTDRMRLVTVLDRLAATFGVTDVSAFIIRDPGYNAALVPNGATASLYVTSAIMQDFELIELEGVVAHLLARHRMGVLQRTAAASVLPLSDVERRDLAGVGVAYRADEVAAAGIRYPLGLASALRKCVRQVVPRESFFASSTYNEWRYVFFDVRRDATTNDLSNLDDVELLAMALEEW